MSTTVVTFSLKLPSGAPVSGGKASFMLSGFDLDGGIVMPIAVEAPIASDGTGSATLWPNIPGLRNTSYKVTVTLVSGERLELGNITVPESKATVALHTLIPTGTIAGLTTVMLTQEEYEAIGEKSAQVLYLIRAA